MSSRTTAGRKARNASRAAGPSPAVRVSCPESESRRAMLSAESALSSTTRMRRGSLMVRSVSAQSGPRLCGGGRSGQAPACAAPPTAGRPSPIASADRAKPSSPGPAAERTRRPGSDESTTTSRRPRHPPAGREGQSELMRHIHPLEPIAVILLIAVLWYMRRQQKPPAPKPLGQGAKPAVVARPVREEKSPEEVYMGLRKEAFQVIPAGLVVGDEPYG